MADENELKELINQAITCEHPHVYGTVNLNRLREVLCLLVSVRKPCEGSFIGKNQSLDEENVPFEEIVREVSKEEVTCNSLQDISNTLSSPAQELNENEVDDQIITTCLSPSTEDVEQLCTLLSLQNVSLELEEVRRKVNEINERICTMELNQPPAKWQCTCNCGVIENDASSSKSNASHADGIFHSKPSSQTNVSELIFDVERDEPLNVSDDLQTTCEVVPSEAAQGNSIFKSASVQSALSASKDFKNNKPAPTDVIVSVEHDNGGVGGQHVDEESALPVLSHNTELKEKMEDAMVEERVFPKFDELMATVDGLVERENMFFERLNTVEKLMSTYIDELYSRLQDEKCVPIAGGFDGMNLDQNLQQESSTPNVAQQRIIDTENLLETNIRFIIEELQNEICSLKIAFNRLNIAAGGKTDVETKTHVQCISCNCAVAMNIHEERIPTPVPFHVSRCTKPMLRRQLDWLKKEMKYSGVAPVSMQPYYQLLKKNKLLSPK